MPQIVLKPLRESEAKYNTRIKYYLHKTHMTVFSVRVFNPYKHELINKSKEKRVVRRRRFNDVDTRNDSLKRTRDKCCEIAYANKFDYFVTFTLDSDKIDRYDRKEILKKFKKWLNNQTQRIGFKYLIFPELHKDGAIHFHGLCSGNIKLRDSGKRTKNGQTIYNSDSWSYGFSSVVKLEGSYDRVVNYIIKYISKDNQKIFGKFYFAGGRGLVREVPTIYTNIEWSEVEGKVYHIPEAKMSVKYVTYDN